MDVSTDAMTATMIGELDPDWQGHWIRASGVWISERMAEFTFEYDDWFETSQPKVDKDRPSGAQFDDDSTLIRRSCRQVNNRNCSTSGCLPSRLESVRQMVNGTGKCMAGNGEPFACSYGEIAVLTGENMQDFSIAQPLTVYAGYTCCRLPPLQTPSSPSASLGGSGGSSGGGQGRRRMQASCGPTTRVALAIFSEDGTSLTWVNGSDHTLNSTIQLNLHVTWYNCELVPEKCTDGGVRYPSTSSKTIARRRPVGMNLANTPHFEGSQFQTQFVANRTYMVELLGIVGFMHIEKTAITVGQNLGPYDWLEFETAPFPAYLKTHVDPGIRPRGALPSQAVLQTQAAAAAADDASSSR
jgi:hypothetical protein